MLPNRETRSKRPPMASAIQTVVEASKAGVVPKRRTGPKRKVEEPNRSEAGRDAGWRGVKGLWGRRSRMDRGVSREWGPAAPERDRLLARSGMSGGGGRVLPVIGCPHAGKAR